MVHVFEKFDLPAFVGIGQRAAFRDMFQLKMLGLARQPEHCARNFPQRVALGERAKKHAYQVVLGLEALYITIRIAIFGLFFYHFVVYQRNQLSENGFARKISTFTHRVFCFAT